MVRADGALGKARELIRTPSMRSSKHETSTYSGEWREDGARVVGSCMVADIVA
jgi:S-methylmethionine-dependent homocysteine/selenocysteine methylase